MLAEFENQNGKYRVLWDGPWNFDKYLIVIKDFDGAQHVKNIYLKEAYFWVYVHDLLLMIRNEYIGRTVCLAMGRVEEVDLD